MVDEVGTQSQNAAAKMVLRSLGECGNSTLQWCKMPRLVKVFILGSGVVFTSEVGMTRVNRSWKAYPARNKDKRPESEHEAEKC